MIPTQELVSFPEFANTGTRVEPEAAKYSEGFVPADVFPAEHANWLFNKASKGITEINAGLESVENELNNIVEAAGSEPSEATSNQLLNAINYLIDQKIMAKMKSTYRVGRLLVETTGVNPAETLGFGTWELYGSGRVLVGAGTGTDANGNQKSFEAGDVGGEYTHALTSDEMPSHTHAFTGNETPTKNGGVDHNHSGTTLSITGGSHSHRALCTGGTTDSNRSYPPNSVSKGWLSSNYGGAGGPTYYQTNAEGTNLIESSGHSHSVSGNTGSASAYSHSHNFTPEGTNGNTGGGSAHNNMQPYITVYTWRRTA